MVLSAIAIAYFLVAPWEAIMANRVQNATNVTIVC